MANLGGLLTQKLGPFPGWVWALGVGGAVFFLGPKLLGKSSGSTAGSSGFDPQSFAAGYAQGAQSGNQPAPNPQPAPVQPTDLGAPPGVPQSEPNPNRWGERLPGQPL